MSPICVSTVVQLGACNITVTGLNPIMHKYMSHNGDNATSLSRDGVYRRAFHRVSFEMPLGPVACDPY